MVGSNLRPDRNRDRRRQAADSELPAVRCRCARLLPFNELASCTTVCGASGPGDDGSTSQDNQGDGDSLKDMARGRGPLSQMPPGQPGNKTDGVQPMAPRPGMCQHTISVVDVEDRDAENGEEVRQVGCLGIALSPDIHYWSVRRLCEVGGRRATAVSTRGVAPLVSVQANAISFALAAMRG